MASMAWRDRWEEGWIGAMASHSSLAPIATSHSYHNLLALDLCGPRDVAWRRSATTMARRVKAELGPHQGDGLLRAQGRGGAEWRNVAKGTSQCHH
uniref:Uncharacterized protein n=1 Tax=Oryza meridionalis TaxID=40149 RepID=A0A0E0FCG4_9ORYZ